MTSISCHCLNVTVSLVSPAILTTDQKWLSEQMGTKRIGDAKLKGSGPFMELENLVNTRIVSGWKVYKCCNCNVDVCAIDINNSSRGLINMELDDHGAKDPHKLDKDGPRFYSPCFRVILEDEHSSDTLGASKDLQAIDTFNKLQKQVDTYVSGEERQMEKRIRAFIKEQQEAFNEIKSKANKDRAILWRKLCKINETYGSTQNITLVARSNSLPSTSPYKIASSAPSAIAPITIKPFSLTSPTNTPQTAAKSEKPDKPKTKIFPTKGFQINASTDGGIFSFDDDEEEEVEIDVEIEVEAPQSATPPINTHNAQAEELSDDEDRGADSDMKYLATSLPVHILNNQPSVPRKSSVGRRRGDAVVVKNNQPTQHSEPIPSSVPRESWSSRSTIAAEEVPEEVAASFTVPLSLNRRIKSLI